MLHIQLLVLSISHPVLLDEVSTAGTLSKSLQGWIHGVFSKQNRVADTDFMVTILLKKYF